MPLSPEEARSLAERIATGHARIGHRPDFLSLPDVNAFSGFIQAILESPDAERTLLRGRRAYWNEPSGTIVIANPGDPDGGTAFEPVTGRSYFEAID